MDISSSNLLLSIFESPHKKRRKYNRYRKIYLEENPKNNKQWEDDVGALENSQKLVEGVQKYKIWILTIYFWLMRALMTKKIQFEKEKSKIRCLWTQLNFIECLIEFMKGLIARKKCFLSQFRL